jgi:hypothetical protein
MTGRTRSWRTPRTATILLGLILVVIVGWLVVALQRATGVFSGSGPDLGFVLQVGLPFPIVGWVISRRSPDNALAWIFLVGPLCMLVSFLPLDLLELSDPVEVAGSRAATAAWFLAETLFFAGVSLIASQFLVRFPTGEPPSRRWRIVTIGGAAGVAITTMWSVARPCAMAFAGDLPEGTAVPSCSAPGDGAFTRLDNPFGLGGVFGGAVDLVGGIGGTLVGVALLAGAVSLFVRYRGASDVERTQLRWLLAAVGILAPVFAGIAAVEVITGRPLEGPLGQIVIGSALLALPLAIGLAITRYRLYEIDRIISRTVTYGVVVVVLAALFGVLAAAPTLVLGSSQGGETPAWVVAVSTLAVAALFTPLRRRVQTVVDRRFDRARFDAQSVVEGFADRVRDETDLETVTAGLGTVTGEVFRPESVGVWVRTGSE